MGNTIREHSQQVAAETVKDAKEFLHEVGLPIGGAYSNVPIEIVQAVASGQLYTGDWTLSRALWLNTVETQRDVQSIVAQGILENKSAYDIAKDLEKYVDPSARKDWEWSKVYPGTRKVVDYNAQRLARTMVSHAYQQAFVRTTIKNPFITKYQWQAANGERVCEICMERDGKLFDKDDLPLDHPNGMCTYLAVIEDSMEDVADRLADWVHGESDPELDEWAKDLYGRNWEKKYAEFKYTDSEKQALTTYTGFDHGNINGYLLGRSKFDTPEIRSIVSQIDSAMEKSPLHERMTVYRGAGLGEIRTFNSTIKNQAWFNLDSNLKSLQGLHAEWPTFLSTTTDPNIAREDFSRGLVWKFIAEPGTHAISMENLSLNKGEKELLFARGTQIEILQVDSIDGRIEILARLIKERN